MSPIRVDDDLLPTSIFAIRLTRLNQPAGWLAGEFSLEEMWRMVDQIRIGDHGFAMVVGPGGELIAHGDPDKKALVAQDAQHERPSAVRRQPRPAGRRARCRWSTSTRTAAATSAWRRASRPSDGP